jgi:hypothetical protein
MAEERIWPAVLIDIRKAVVRHHEDALHALSVLEQHLVLQTVDASLLSQLSNIQRLIGGSMDRPSIRQRVLAAIPDGGATVEAIPSSTGLTKRQVRGVLYAPEVKEFITNNRTSGENRFYHRTNPLSGERLRS